MTSQSKSASLSMDGISVDFLLQFAKENAVWLDSKSTTEVVTWIRERTQAYHCSYSDLLKQQGRGKEVSTATVFASHSWNGSFLGLVDSVEQYQLSTGQEEYIWMDIFVVPQNPEDQAQGENVWFDGFEDNLRSIGRVLVVLNCWDQPIYLTRSWCLFELFVTLSLKLKYMIILPREEKLAFLAFLTHGGDIVDMFAKVDMAQATAFKRADQDKINSLVVATFGGHGRLNEAVLRSLREWIVQTASEASELAEPSSAVRLHTARMMTMHLGRSQEASDLLRAFLQARRAAAPGGDRETVTALMQLGDASWRLGDYHGAIRVLDEALEAGRRLFGGADPSIGDGLNYKGLVLEAQGQQDEALSAHTEALAIRIAALGGAHPAVGQPYNNIGLVHHSQGRLADARQAHTEALRIRRAALGDAHAEVAGSYNNLGRVLQEEGSNDEALTMHQRAMDIWKAALGDEHPTIGASYNNIAVCHETKGEHPAALEAHRQALAIRVAALGDGHPDVANSCDNLGVLLVAMGRAADALPMHTRALEIRRAALGPLHTESGGAAWNTAAALLRLGRPAEVLPYLHAAADAFTAGLGPQHPRTAEAAAVIKDVEADPGAWAACAAFEDSETPAIGKPESAGSQAPNGKADCCAVA